jgi:hypothetical protein
VIRDSINRRARWLLAWPLLIAMVGLGLLSVEASRQYHRHSAAGVILAHDHLSAGPHSHRDEPARKDPGKPGPPGPEDPEVYLGEAPIYSLFDSGWATPRLPVLVCESREAGPLQACTLFHEYSPGPARAPPIDSLSIS